VTHVCLLFALSVMKTYKPEQKTLTAYTYLRVISVANAESFTNGVLHLIITN